VAVTLLPSAQHLTYCSLLKSLLKALLRRRMAIIRATSESAYRQAVVDFVNLLLGNHASSRLFWCAPCLLSILMYV
jgi:hypothetical protein